MKNTSISLFKWLIPLSFFTYQFILRLWPSLTMQDIMEQFAVDATSYGVLASIYYYGYSSMQIPIAIFLDKYGPKFVLVICALLCAFGMFISTHTESWNMILFSRLCIGIGSAGGFLSTSKVIAQQFASENYGRMVGFSFSIGLFGAIYGGRPTSELIAQHGWQHVGFILSLSAVCIALLALVFLKQKSQNKTNKANNFELSNIVDIIKSPVIIALAIANLLMVGSLEGFADVWGVNYLVALYNIDKSIAAEIVSFVPVGMIFGGPTLAFISKRIGEHVTIFIAGLIMTLCITYILYSSTEFNALLLKCIFFIIGIMCCYQVLVFTIGNNISQPSTLSLTIAFLNCINMLGGAFFHTLIGIGMDIFNNNDSIAYCINAYQKALLVIPLCSLIGSIIILLLRNKMLNMKSID